eukprot:maker-scaffold200_size264178-snap-gene-1.15 protein:Tk07734 transcript:maker-scaffold200_size264178-snap-gene-1.15-mRNA-1 annotation:"hypothetical protein LOTGIDRAFT_227060"
MWNKFPALREASTKRMASNVAKNAQTRWFQHFKRHSPARRQFLLGIETSCDDTGAAILSEKGELLGEALMRQPSTEFGGVVPSFAMGFHAQNLPKVTESVLAQAKLSMDDIQYIAVTNRPGLKGSLSVGLDYVKYLSQKHQIPVIPIHHMEAHALTIRMIEQVEFPFLVLLASGGHCLLAIAEDIGRFKVLGQHRDNSPGEVIDKAARCLRLHSLRTDLRSMSGLKSSIYTFVAKAEKQAKLEPDEILPNVQDIAASRTNEISLVFASFQYAIARHICHRLQRAFDYLHLTEVWSDEDLITPSLVVSGGVASNLMIRNSILKVCDEYNVKASFPPPKYCTDNGVMIAWNGFEKYRRNMDIVPPSEVMNLEASPRIALGEDYTKVVHDRQIKCKWPDKNSTKMTETAKKG